MIACLTLPYFAAAVERRADGALAELPLVVGGRPWEANPLFGFSYEAARRGVRPGMPLRQAHLLTPDARFLPAAPPRYLEADGEAVGVLLDFTHLVAPEPLWQPEASRRPASPAITRTVPARYTLDLEALPLREALSLAREMGRSLRSRTHLEPAVGLAAGPFTAQVAAALVQTGHVRPVEPGAERAFLAGRSLAFLPLEKETARRLRLLGIHTLGQFAALSPVALREQFGAAILPLHQLAQGEGSAPPPPPPPSSTKQTARRFEPPLVSWLDVHSVLQQMAVELSQTLVQAAMRGRTLCLLLETERDDPCRLSLPLRRPAAGARCLAQAAWELVQSLALREGITAITLAVADLQPDTVRQLSLFEQQAAPDTAGLLPQMIRRHPAASFLQPVRVDAAHPLAARRFDLRPL